MKMNNQKLPNTDITLKEFKELLFKQFEAYPMMKTDYKNKTFIISKTYYDNVDIELKELCDLCDKLNIKYKVNISSVSIQIVY
jgi:hypothetical protein